MYPQKQLKFINEKLMKRQLCTSNLYLKIQIGTQYINSTAQTKLTIVS